MENLPSDKNDAGVEVSALMLITYKEHRDLGSWWSVPALSKFICQVYWYLQESGGMLRSNGASTEAYIH